MLLANRENITNELCRRSKNDSAVGALLLVHNTFLKTLMFEGKCVWLALFPEIFGSKMCSLYGSEEEMVVDKFDQLFETTVNTVFKKYN